MHTTTFRTILLVPLALVAAVLSERSPTAAQIIQLTEGADLQHALDSARPGDTILLRPGAIYAGNFVLPAKGGTAPITVRTADAPGQPRPGVRVRPSHAPLLAKLRSPNRQPALRTAAGATHWRLELLEFLPTQGGSGDIIALGDGGSRQRTLEQVPKHLVIDRCYIHGDPVEGQKRGIALNSGETTITGSYISDIKVRGQDSQAIAGWNGPGPFTIENNYLEGAGENFLLGGADPSIEGLVPADVTFRRNHLAKPIEWRKEKWQVKNLFELKNARRVLVEGNLMEYAWQQAQVGYAIVLTPRNQDGNSPWSTLEDITIRRNIVRHAGGGMQIIGADTTHPSGPTRRVQVSGNLFYDIDHRRWGGTGAFLLIGEGPSDISIVGNTVSQSGNIVMAYGGTKSAPAAVSGFRFRDNLILHNQYGVHGADRAPGGDSLQAFFPGAEFTSNGIGGGEARLYPGGNHFVDVRDFERQFVDASRGDFRLAPGSRFRGAAAGGGDLGADLRALALALGIRPGTPLP